MRSFLTRVLGTLTLLAVAVAGTSACSAQKTVAAGKCAIGVTTDLSKEPGISVPSCAVAPKTLQITDVVKGTGPAAKAGDSVTVKYYGAGFANRTEFDASWDDGAPNAEFTVAPLGQANVIAGWNQGLIGATVGSRRLLVIPPSLGYGAAGEPPTITKSETLIFVVDIIKIG
jgi:peptidylprolyl isomerase